MQALIFDMDGVMIDSEIHWIVDEKDYIGTLVPKWNPKDQTRVVGMSPRGSYDLLIKEYGLKMTWEDYKIGFDRVADVIYGQKAELLEGFLEFIQSVQGQFRMAVASSADLKNIQLILNRFKLHPFFEVVVSGQEVGGRGKPAPDIYLHAAKKLGVPPVECVVIEDACNGVLAAKAAGMFAIGLRNGINDGQDLSMADQEARGFKEIKL